MWLFTRYGFFSAVCARTGDGRHNQPVDPERIMVRARCRDHLQALQGQFSQQLGGREILEFSQSDYAYRIFVPKAAWSQVLAALGDELDYDNFKAEVARFQQGQEPAYLAARHNVWAEMSRLQQ